MFTALLQLDGALSRQDGLQSRVAAAEGAALDYGDLGPALRLWSRPDAMARLEGRLRADLAPANDPVLAFLGSGDFHHVTPLLLRRAIERAGEPVTLLHFDNHPDWVRAAPGRHCGSWLGVAARMDGVARVITIGVCSPDISRRKAHEGDLALIAEGRLELYAWTSPDGGGEVALGGRAWPTITALGETAFLDRLEAAIGTRSIYVTIDKDMLRAEDAVTNWDQGEASLDFLLAAIRRAATGRRLAGADVVGDWSEPVYGDGLASWALKRGEALLDQPWARPRAEAAKSVNEATNLRLLALFADVAA